jgi:hypothetical protein
LGEVSITADAPKYGLPPRIPAYLRRLAIEYERTGEKVLHGIVAAGKWQVEECAEFDNWNGGQSGHNLIIRLAPQQLGQVPLASQRETAERVRTDLNAASASIENEYISNVYLEMDDGPVVAGHSGEPLPLFWKPGHLRLFVSHRDAHKHIAHALARELEEYGISSFVAHDTIEPDAEWLVEISRALATMEIMLALITDDFHESVWTNQEVGFALGRGVPVVSAKLGRTDPRGFIQSRQALRIADEDVKDAAVALFGKLSERLNATDRLRGHLLSAFCAATDFNETRRRFDRLRDLKGFTKEDVIQIMNAFPKNSQLHNCYYLSSKNRLVNFLEGCTGRKYQVEGRNIIEEIPF